MPIVLNKYRVSGIPPGAIYIGRPSKWGNPFVLKKGESRDECLAKYRQYVISRPDLIQAAKTELKGKDLVCFCAPKACHGDILIKIANEE